MRILGIDPGYGILGWSIIEDNLVLIDFGTVETDSKLSFDDRLLEIHHELNKIIHRYHPDTAAFERLFFQKNTKTAIDVAKTIGVILLTLKLAGTEYVEYTPSQVKQAVTGYGRASKNQIQMMLKRLLNINEIPKPDDAADAIAIAICHSCRGRMTSDCKR